MLERIDSGLDRLESVPLQRAVYQVLCSVIPESVTTDDQDFSRPPAPWITGLETRKGERGAMCLIVEWFWIVFGLDEMRSKISKATSAVSR